MRTSSRNMAREDRRGRDGSSKRTIVCPGEYRAASGFAPRRASPGPPRSLHSRGPLTPRSVSLRVSPHISPIAPRLVSRRGALPPDPLTRSTRGAACTRYQDAALRNLSSKRIQCDEIWSFVGCKDKNLSQEKKEKGLGSVWTWTALDADSKLILTWLVGSRDAGSAYEFMQDVAGRLRNRVQLTTDGHKPYLNAVEDAFGADIDYAVLQKIYGAEPTDEK